jgi:hypothetical protein
MTASTLVAVSLLSSIPGATPPAVHPAAPVALAQSGPAMRGAPPPPPAPPPGPVMRGSPPPLPPVERVAPRAGYVWVEGNYDWRDGRYAWSGGHWEPERAGYRWHGGHWEWRGDRYVWERGHWVSGPAYAPPPPMVVQTPPPSPPPPQVVAPPPPTRHGFVWIPGAQEWRDGRYVWVEGHWEKEQHGHHWHAGHWDRDGDRHAWHPGGWEGDEGGGPPPPPEGGPSRGPIAREGVSIVGRVVGPNGVPVPGIQIVLAGTSEARAITDNGGSYSFTGLRWGSYAVRPTVPGCSFAPDVVNLNNLAGPAVQNFSTSCGRR